MLTTEDRARFTGSAYHAGAVDVLEAVLPTIENTLRHSHVKAAAATDALAQRVDALVAENIALRDQVKTLTSLVQALERQLPASGA